MRIILFAVLALITIPLVSALDVTIDETKTVCYQNGQFRAEIEAAVKETDEEYSFNCGSIDAYDNTNENYTADFSCYVDGKRKLTPFKILPGESKTITLISPENKFPQRKNVRIRIKIGTKMMYAGAYCPGYQFSCSTFNLGVNCKKTANKFQAIISGMPKLNEEEEGKITEYFEVFPNYRAFYGSPTWSRGGTYTILKMDNKYLMDIFPQDSPGDGIAIKMTKCPEEVYSTFKYTTCYDEFKCGTNADCLSGDTCSEQKACKPLACTPCEFLENSQCKPKNCNDNNPCTTDSCNIETGKCYSEVTVPDCCAGDISCEDGLKCTDNKCIDNKCQPAVPKVCKESDNPCKKFVCREPDGCIEKSKNIWCGIKLFFSGLFKKE